MTWNARDRRCVMRPSCARHDRMLHGIDVSRLLSDITGGRRPPRMVQERDQAQRDDCGERQTEGMRGGGEALTHLRQTLRQHRAGAGFKVMWEEGRGVGLLRGPSKVAHDRLSAHGGALHPSLPGRPPAIRPVRQTPAPRIASLPPSTCSSHVAYIRSPRTSLPLHGSRAPSPCSVGLPNEGHRVRVGVSTAFALREAFAHAVLVHKNCPAGIMGTVTEL
jgi:hypothetical protein